MARQPEVTVFPSDADIRSMLTRRIDDRTQGVGVVVGVIDAGGRRVISHGELERGAGRPVGGDTLFEIGSATKVFTTLLLAEMVSRGEVALDDPIAKYLPAGVAAPTRGGRQITLVDLATHTSGLPPMDPGFRTTDLANPRAGGPKSRGPSRILRRAVARLPERARSSSATSARVSVSTRTSASACWVTCWRCGQAWTSRRCCESASPPRSASPTPSSRRTRISGRVSPRRTMCGCSPSPPCALTRWPARARCARPPATFWPLLAAARARLC